MGHAGRAASLALGLVIARRLATPRAPCRNTLVVVKRLGPRDMPLRLGAGDLTSGLFGTLTSCRSAPMQTVVFMKIGARLETFLGPAAPSVP